MTSEYVREGVVRQQVSLKQLIRNGKALLEEVIEGRQEPFLTQRRFCLMHVDFFAR